MDAVAVAGTAEQLEKTQQQQRQKPVDPHWQRSQIHGQDGGRRVLPYWFAKLGIELGDALFHGGRGRPVPLAT